MSALTSSASVEVIQLDDSIEDNNENGSVHNLSAMDTTNIHFDETLPPGVAPDGYVILDEDVGPPRLRTTNSDDSNDAEHPIFKVVFRDVSAFQTYHEKIERFLKELISPKYNKESVKSKANNLILDIFDSENSFKHSSDICSKAKQSNNSLFTVDTEPKSRDDLDIPMYRKKFNKALQISNETSDIKEDCGPKMSCFNCLGNHSLRDCEEPRNYVAINKNRKNHNAKRGSLNVRYHLDDNQKFGHFMPGQISSNLRRALGIKENDLPRHIYRMRILGYPPGWLEEARLQHSGLALFNSEGCAEGGSDEEGEIICPGDKDKYDIKKIIDFPGFNIEPPYGTREECKQYWGSAMQERYSKTAMLSCLSSKKADAGYVRRKMPHSANLKVRTDVNPGEMDIDEVGETSVENIPIKDLFIPPLPKDNDQPPPPPPPSRFDDSANTSCEDIFNKSDSDCTERSSRVNSPSLSDLETTKKQLLAELDESGAPSTPGSTTTERNKRESSEFNPNLSSTEPPESDTSMVEESDMMKVDVNNVTPKNSPKSQSIIGSGGHKSVLAVHLGTPILKSSSPYRRLPASEKFSKDICDVINFENLPDSTGKYDQMSELLQKVRTTISELHKE